MDVRVPGWMLSLPTVRTSAPRRALVKDLPAAELADAVRLANAGVAQFHSSVARRLALALGRPSAAAQRPPTGADDVLTARESEVLRRVATGCTNQEIAAQTYLSEGTVKNHISRILSRLGLRDRTQAAIHARDHGLI